MGMMHYKSYSGEYPEWDCGPGYNIMGGGRRTEWSPCNALDYRRMYTQYHDDWCMSGMAIPVVEFLSRVYKIGKIFA